MLQQYEILGKPKEVTELLSWIINNSDFLKSKEQYEELMDNLNFIIGIKNKRKINEY